MNNTDIWPCNLFAVELKGVKKNSFLIKYEIILPFTDGGFLGGSEFKASACNAGDLGLIPGLERAPGKENGNPLQYSCLENPMDREV